MAGARKLRVMPKVLQAMGKELSCQGDYCHELLLGGPVSRRVQSLNRSQGIYDFVMCGREAAHRWKKGWTHGWKKGVLSGSVPPKYTSGTCGARNQAVSFQLHHPQQTCQRFISSAEGPGTALLLTWVLLSVSREGLLEVMAGCYRSKTRAHASSLLST